MDGLQDDTAFPTTPSPVDEESDLILEEGEREAWGDAMLRSRMRRPYAAYKKAHPQGDLCKRCACINWPILVPSVASRYHSPKDGFELFRVPESSQELSASTCRLCRFLGTDQDFDGEPYRALILDCGCWTSLRSDDLMVPHRIRLWLTEQKPMHILQDACADEQNYLVRKLTPGLIDYEELRHWLTHCKRQHFTDRSYVLASSIPGFRVFDCNAGKVVPAPQDTAFSYIALSYVWGGVRISEKEQADFPATIRDAITVTLELGYKYLWVDQFCIHQSNEAHKQSQIKLMGRIYAEADLVIIAAAGSSSHHGLPGVSTRHRQAQRTIELDTDVNLIQTFDVCAEFASNTWATRAWTHQEGYLAKRRLVFTDHEVLCVCEHGVWQESVRRPGIGDHISYMGNDYAGFPLQWMEDLQSRVDESRVSELLEDYSSRKLSMDSDILNACIGMLEKLVNRHFWGMVIMSNTGSSAHYHLSLGWRTRRSGKRRMNFPTWSWVATTGPLSISWVSEHDKPDFVAEIPTADGRWLTPVSHTESRYEPLPEDSCLTLRLTGLFYIAFLTTTREFGETQGHGEDHVKVSKTPCVIFEHAVVDGDDLEIAIEFLPDTKLSGMIAGDTVKAVLVTGSSELNYTWQYHRPPGFMILQAVGDHYRRIGFTNNRCWIIKKKTGLQRKEDRGFLAPYLSCRGDEEVIYVE